MLKKRFSLTIISIFLFNILTIRESFLMEQKKQVSYSDKYQRIEKGKENKIKQKLKTVDINELERVKNKYLLNKKDNTCLVNDGSKEEKIKKLKENKIKQSLSSINDNKDKKVKIKSLSSKREDAGPIRNKSTKRFNLQPKGLNPLLTVPEKKIVKQRNKTLRLKKRVIKKNKPIPTEQSSIETITSFNNYMDLKNNIFTPQESIIQFKSKSLNQIIDSIFYDLNYKIRKQLTNINNWFTTSKHSNPIYMIKYPEFRYIKKEFLKESEKIILIGDLHGNFDDFNSIIIDLIKREILTPKLELNPNYKIVILGDFIDRGLNSLSIALTMMLMQTINFNQVIVLQGNHENMASDDIANRYDTKFYDELFKKTKIKYETYKSQFKRYFKSLPSAYFIRDKDIKSFMFNHGGWTDMPAKLTAYLQSNQTFMQIPTIMADQLMWNDIDFKNEIQKERYGIRGDANLLEYPQTMVSAYMDTFNIVAKFGGHMHQIPKGPSYNFEDETILSPGFIRDNNIYVLISGDIQSFDQSDTKINGFDYKASYLELDISKKQWHVDGYVKNVLDNNFKRTKVPSY